MKQEIGMRCLKCGCRKSYIIDSRTFNDGTEIRRRRQCLNGHRWTTYEKIVKEPEIDYQI